MATVLNITAILFFITALVLFSIRIVRAYRRDGMKGGLIAKGHWGLWAAGVVALLIGLGLHTIATDYTTPDPVELADRQALSQALSGSVDVSTSTSQATIPDDGPALQDALDKAQLVSKESPDGDDDVDPMTFPAPVYVGKISAAGYPIYAIQCDEQKDQCSVVNAMGNLLSGGTLKNEAEGLSPIRNADVINPAYHCHYICKDAQGDIVGAVSPDMQAYVDAHPQP